MTIKRTILTLFSVLLLSACGPNLHYSEPTANKNNEQMEISVAYNNLSQARMEIYHQMKKGKHGKQADSIKKAREALWELSLLRDGLVVVLNEYKNQNKHAIEVSLGKKLVQSMNDLLLQSARYINVYKGYTHAYLDNNLSYLTDRNQTLFNGLDIKLVQVSEVFLEDLKQFSVSNLGNTPIPKKILTREISLQIDTKDYPEEASRLQVLFKKHLEVYGVKVVPNNNSVLAIDIKDVEIEGVAYIAGKVILTVLIPNNSIAKTSNRLLVKIHLETGATTCNIDFLDKIDISLDNWEELENFLVRMAVEELRYGNCFTP